VWQRMASHEEQEEGKRKKKRKKREKEEVTEILSLTLFVEFHANYVKEWEGGEERAGTLIYNRLIGRKEKGREGERGVIHFN